MNSLCEHWQAWVPGRFSFFTLSLQEQGFRGRNNPRASQDLCKSSYTPASITTSLQAFIFSLLMVPQVTKQSIEWVPLVGDWRETAATKPMEKTLQLALIHSIPLVWPPAVSLHLFHAEAWLKTPPLVLYQWSLSILLIWTEKHFYFLLFSCFT